MIYRTHRSVTNSSLSSQISDHVSVVGQNLTLTESFCEWWTLFSEFWIIHLVAPEIWCWLTIDDAMTIQCPGVGPEHSWCVDVELRSYQVSCSSRTEPPLFLYPPTHRLPPSSCTLNVAFYFISTYLHQSCPHTFLS